ncbi:hypothetical protein [Novosphingobium sp. CECT 9465]|uniref:hypothetical protein n=1 Tax=Novosphingobium sp. CECT 9465 TaxID=2829794 RepID=UPI001E4F4D02|nr:hypothetical protein [Novosphingobium sp. CECT 9465]CAH0496425.1 hypothetical protein NVSP9465_01459 [Novosphingobium sp. CECT 9465]
MTIVLGLLAALSLVRFIFSLTAVALPVSVALSFGFALRSQGVGSWLSLFAAVGLGFGVLAVGSAAYRRCRAPLGRLLLGFLFVLPAGTAGFVAGRAFGGRLLESGLAIGLVAILCAAISAQSALEGLRGEHG